MAASFPKSAEGGLIYSLKSETVDFLGRTGRKRKKGVNLGTRTKKKRVVYLRGFIFQWWGRDVFLPVVMGIEGGSKSWGVLPNQKGQSCRIYHNKTTGRYK